MARYRTTVTTPLSPADAFAYMAAFENVAQWDPGIQHAERLTAGEVRLGSIFLVVVSFLGTKMELRYAVTEFEPGTSMTVVAQNPLLRSVDRIDIGATSEGTTVTYDAKLTLRGVMALGSPVLSVVFKQVGDRARDGLRRALA